MPYIIYACIESSIETNRCMSKQFKKLFNKRIPCGYSMSTIWAIDHIEKEHNFHRGKECMKNICTSLREHAKIKNIIDFGKTKMPPLTKLELKPHQDAKVCYICEKRILKKLSKSVNCHKIRDHCHYKGKYTDAAHSICNLKFNIFFITIHIMMIIDNHFIIKNSQKGLRENLNLSGKIEKSTTPFLFQ